MASSTETSSAKPATPDPEKPHDNDDDTTTPAAAAAGSLRDEAPPTLGPAPDGGLRAWLVAAGASCVLFGTMGFMNSLGVFQAYYMRSLLGHRSPDDIAWIGSLQAFFIFAAGAVGGPLFDRYGAAVLRPAAVLYVLSFVATSFCERYWHFMLAQGVLMGASNGLLMFPCMGAISHWWDEGRGKAMGIAIAGSSAGGIVWPVVLAQLLEESDLGFGWSIRVCGLAMVPFLGFAVFAVTSRHKSKEGQQLVSLEPWRNRMFVGLAGAQFLMSMGMFVPLFFLAAYAELHGMGSTLATYLVAMINGASLPGRVIAGIAADKFGRLNMLFGAGLSTGVLVLCWTKATSTAGIIVYSVFFGFCSGVIVSGGSVALTLTTNDPTNMGTILGMGMFTTGIAVLIAPPINGALLERYGGFLEISIFSGVLTLVGALGVVAVKILSGHGIWSRY